MGLEKIMLRADARGVKPFATIGLNWQ